jgi:protein-S-isoprenylcysteine O-methyltransferase Ste14
MISNLVKSILHNLGVVAVGFAFAFLGTRLDWFFSFQEFQSLVTAVAAWLLLASGFLLRVWATFDFYRRQMKVIVLKPQKPLITSGPYRFTRNPLYLGGNVFIFGGAVLLLGSPGGFILTVLNIIAVDLMIRREEKQLEKIFGKAFTRYKNQVPRWL